MLTRFKRFFALLIDHAICLTMAALPISFLLQIKLLDEEYIEWIMLAMLALYSVLMLSKDAFCGNASFGKRILRLRIERINGKKFNLATSLARNIIMPVLFPFEIYYLFKYGERLGDRLAKTKVVGVATQADNSPS